MATPCGIGMSGDRQTRTEDIVQPVSTGLPMTTAVLPCAQHHTLAVHVQDRTSEEAIISLFSNPSMTPKKMYYGTQVGIHCINELDRK